MKPPSVRMLLAGFAVLAVIQLLLSTSAYMRLTTDRDGDFRLPLPSRVAAIVDALETVAPEHRAIVLDAFRDLDFDVWISDEPDYRAGEAPYDMAHVARVVDRYVGDLGERDVIAWMVTGRDDNGTPVRFERLRLWSDHPMRLAVSLQTGDWLLIETRGRLHQRVFGLPSGLVSGFLGVIVATLSLLTLWRGLGPLETLSRRLAGFAAEPTAVDLELRGPRETRDVTRAVNRMQHEIADLISERRAMFAGMSHDLRTYLTRLRLRIEAIDDETARAKAEDDLAQMGAIVEDGLALAQLEAAPLNAEVTDLAELVEGLVAEEPTLHAPTFEPPDGDFTVLCDPFRLRRALLNLVINATRHARDPEIVVTRTLTSIDITVADRGQGISAQEKARLLQPFERGDQARSHNTPGSGLGLAISRRVAEQHDGALHLLDRPGGGLMARITIPLEKSGD